MYGSQRRLANVGPVLREVVGVVRVKDCGSVRTSTRGGGRTDSNTTDET